MVEQREHIDLTSALLLLYPPPPPLPLVKANYFSFSLSKTSTFQSVIVELKIGQL
jgi:hypothetical protein